MLEHVGAHWSYVRVMSELTVTEFRFITPGLDIVLYLLHLEKVLQGECGLMRRGMKRIVDILVACLV